MSIININKTSLVSDLNWYIKSFKAEDPVKDLISYFTSENSRRCVIIRNESSYMLLSKEAYNKTIKGTFRQKVPGETIDNIFSSLNNNTTLIIPDDMPVDKAVYMAIQRKEPFKFDPVIVKFKDGSCGIVDFQSLILSLLQSFAVSQTRLSAATEFKKDIVGILTYDFRNVLNTIQGFAHIIEEEDCSREETKEYSSFIKSAAGQISSLLLKMLHSFCEESAEIMIYKTRFNVYNFLKDIILSFNNDVEIKHQQISMKEVNEEKRKDLYADKNRIQEVIETLVSNAIKYSHIGGKISVTLLHLDDSISISVKDSGQGMTDSYLKKLFSKFIHLNSQPIAGELSMGLSLYISRKIIGLHSGKITVNSELGKGSVFTVEIPLCTK